MALRYWAIATLGERWNTRVIVVPGAPAVTAGPYRFLRHPNYLAVVVEVAALPLVHGAWLTALVASGGQRARSSRCASAARSARSQRPADYDAALADRAALPARRRADGAR